MLGASGSSAGAINRATASLAEIDASADIAPPMELRDPLLPTRSPRIRSPPDSPSTPLLFRSDSRSPAGSPGVGRNPNRLPYVPSQNSLMSSKMRYYRMLAPHQAQHFQPPDHVLPPSLFVIFGTPDKKVGSLTTIFTIWNTMMGSGLLAMPWGFGQSGIVLGVFITIGIGLVSFISCSIILDSCLNRYDDFSDACNKFIGPRGRKMAVLSSTLLMAGASIVYVVVIITCFYDFVNLFLYVADGQPDDFESPPQWNIPIASACFFAMLFALTLVQEMSALMKLNRLGIINVVFQLIFFVVKSFLEPNGIQLNSDTELASSGFVYLSGILMVSFFIHNAIIPIMKANKNQENNKRDLVAGFICVIISYLIVGILPNLAFEKDDIKQNFLEIFDIGDFYAFVARTGVLFQLTTIYPLLLYVVRTQIFVTYLEQPSVTKRQSTITNISLILIGIGIAILGVEIGLILSYVGSLCGLVYIFVLPPVLQIQQQRRHDGMKIRDYLKYGSIITVGFCVFILRILSDFVAF